MSPGGVQGENHETLEFDDLLYENAVFSKPQGLPNEVERVPKRAEGRKRSRERREKRTKYADERLGIARERSRADRRPPGKGGGGSPVP